MSDQHQPVTMELLYARGYEQRARDTVRREVRCGPALLYYLYVEASSFPSESGRYRIAARLSFGATRVIKLSHNVTTMACVEWAEDQFHHAFWALKAQPWEGETPPLTQIAHAGEDTQ